MKQSPVKYGKYSVEKNKNENLKNIEKYYDYYNVYKPKKNVPDNTKNVVPNRKLSPIRKNVINIS